MSAALMACGVVLTAAPFTTCRFMPHSARIGVVLASIEFHVIFIVNKLPKIPNAPQGAGRLIAVSVERQVPLEVETTRFFNVNLWSAPPSVYTTFVVALQSIMHFGLTTRWTTNSTKQTVPRVNDGVRHGLQCWTSRLHAVESHWPVVGAFKVRLREISRAARAIDITNRLQCLDVHAIQNNVCEERLMSKL